MKNEYCALCEEEDAFLLKEITKYRFTKLGDR